MHAGEAKEADSVECQTALQHQHSFSREVQDETAKLQDDATPGDSRYVAV